jgi:hypothetical protein
MVGSLGRILRDESLVAQQDGAGHHGGEGDDVGWIAVFRRVFRPRSVSPHIRAIAAERLATLSAAARSPATTAGNAVFATIQTFRLPPSAGEMLTDHDDRRGLRLAAGQYVRSADVWPPISRRWGPFSVSGSRSSRARRVM